MGQVVSLTEAVQARQGHFTVFTNGVFDMLHRGHLYLFQEIRKLADTGGDDALLIVGVNSETSTQRLKGPLRPIVTEGARAGLLAELSMVDYVVLFDADTPLDLIVALKPDVLVKGPGYTPETVVGAGIMQAYGGRIVIIPPKRNVSTSATIGRIIDPNACYACECDCQADCELYRQTEGP